jgi:DNA mismatch repair protein MutS
MVSQPLLEVKAIRERQSAVQFFFERGTLRTDLRAALKSLGDLERLTNRILSASVQPRDLIALRNTLAQLPAVYQLLSDAKNAAKDLPYLSQLIQKFETFDEEYSLLTQAIAEDPPMTLQKSGFIKAGFSTELDEIYQRASHAREWIANLESTERTRTGIKTLKVGYNKVFGYYIEVTKPNLNLVPPEYIRKQTLVNAERFITPEMKDAETVILNAEEAIRDVELRLFRENLPEDSSISRAGCWQLHRGLPRLMYSCL